jgi:alcohol dehydrogenase class IV
VVDFNAGTVPAKAERVHKIVDPKAASLADALRQLRGRLGLPSGLRSEGVQEADIPKLAAKAFEDACHRSNPRPTTQADLAKLYQASL